MSDNNPFENITGNQFAWAFLGIPAILAWIGYGAGYLLDPHLIEDINPLMWAFYGAAGWYGLMLVIGGGWLGLLAIGSAL